MEPEDICTPEYADAPFCAGPSLRECAGGVEVAEDEACPGNDLDALGEPPAHPARPTPTDPLPEPGGTNASACARFDGDGDAATSCYVDEDGFTVFRVDTEFRPVPDDEMYSCEELGTCDDSCSPPARDDCHADAAVPVTAEPPAAVAELPVTGLDAVSTLALLAGACLAAGAALLRRT